MLARQTSTTKKKPKAWPSCDYGCQLASVYTHTQIELVKRISPHMQLLHPHQGVFDPRDESILDREHKHLLYICLYIWSTFGLLYNFIIFFGQKKVSGMYFAMLMMQRDWLTNNIFAKGIIIIFIFYAMQTGSVTGQRGQKDLSGK